MKAAPLSFLLALLALLADTVVGFRATPQRFAVVQTAALPRKSPRAVAPGVMPLTVACTIPTLLWYWKSEYGVSYAYGTAMLATGTLVLASRPTSVLANAHATCLALYGARLNLFLLWRELTIPRFREFRCAIGMHTCQLEMQNVHLYFTRRTQ